MVHDPTLQSREAWFDFGLKEARLVCDVDRRPEQVETILFARCTEMSKRGGWGL